MHAVCVPGNLRGQKVSDPLDLELQMAVSHRVRGCWKLNWGPQEVPSTKPSLHHHHHLKILLNYFYFTYGWFCLHMFVCCVCDRSLQRPEEGSDHLDQLVPMVR